MPHREQDRRDNTPVFLLSAHKRQGTKSKGGRGLTKTKTKHQRKNWQGREVRRGERQMEDLLKK